MTRRANAAYVRKDAARWKTAGWTSIPNSIIRDEDIHPYEAWAWSWLASHDGDFEVSGRKLYEANKHIGRNRAYELLSNLERAGYLLRTHEYDPEVGVPYVQYHLQPVPVPEEERTWEPPRAKPRNRGPHPGSKAARSAPETPVDNLEPAGQDGFPTGRESTGRPRIPDRAETRPDQRIPDRAGGGGVLPDRAGRGVPDRAGIHTYIEKNNLEEQKDTRAQRELFAPDPTVTGPDASPAGSVTDHLDALFDEFYDSYPRRVGRKEARRKFETALKSGVTAREVIDGARRYAEAMTGTPARYVKHPSTWLHQGCWADEHPAPETQPVGNNGYQPYRNPVDQDAYYTPEW